MALPRLPSAYFLENVYVTFQDDPVAFALTGLLNPKRCSGANDYPAFRRDMALEPEHSSPST
jgi:hypothetical protein